MNDDDEDIYRLSLLFPSQGRNRKANNIFVHTYPRYLLKTTKFLPVAIAGSTSSADLHASLGT